MYLMWKPYEWHILLAFIQLSDMELYFGAMQLTVMRFLNCKKMAIRIMSGAKP
jgi:hypothetical protein